MPGYLVIRERDGELVPEKVETTVVPTLDVLQEAVGGNIEPMFTVDSPFRKHFSITAYVNEEGLLIRLPILGAVVDDYGYRPFAGNMICTALDERDGDTALMTDQELQHLFEQVIRWQYGTLDDAREVGIMVDTIIYPLSPTPTSTAAGV